MVKVFSLILIFYCLSIAQNNVNLCSGGIRILGYINVDIVGADINIDLEAKLLPFENNSKDTILCMSAVNYFTKERGLEIIKDCYRVLKPGGIARFGVQDLKVFCRKYLAGDPNFSCDRINRLLGHGDGYISNGKKNKYFYDFPTLADLFYKAGFKKVNEVKFNSRLDNRPEQMFYLEGIK